MQQLLRAGMAPALASHRRMVAHVAAEFPQLCEAETAVIGDQLFTDVLGDDRMPTG